MPSGLRGPLIRCRTLRPIRRRVITVANCARYLGQPSLEMFCRYCSGVLAYGGEYPLRRGLWLALYGPIHLPTTLRIVNPVRGTCGLDYKHLTCPVSLFDGVRHVLKVDRARSQSHCDIG